MAKSLAEAGIGVTVNGGGGAMYTATSLEDLAGAFDVLAANEQERVSHVQTQRQRRYVEGQVAAYQDAARMLRATTLVGHTLPAHETALREIMAHGSQHVIYMDGKGTHAKECLPCIAARALGEK